VLIGLCADAIDAPLACQGLIEECLQGTSLQCQVIDALLKLGDAGAKGRGGYID
jgi:hypothetical protein